MTKGTVDTEGTPRVTVLMSVRDGAQYVAEAVQSILDQTFVDFEFLIIDDGSTDATPDILARFSDPRLRIFRYETNLGLTRRLNQGIALARGEYLARTDADDCSARDRLDTQVGFLDARPEVGLVGSFCRCTTLDSTVSEWVYPTDDSALRAGLARRNLFVHSSVMLRRQVFDVVGGYDESLIYVQDYELWGRVAARFAVANIPEFLVTRRITPDALSQSRDLAWKRFRAHVVAQLSVAYRLGRPFATIWLARHLIGYVKLRVARTRVLSP